MGDMRERLWALVAVIAAALYAACGGATGPGGEQRAAGTQGPGSGARGAAEFGFSAETRVAETAPLTLQTVMTVTNQGRAAAELVVSRYCPVHLRVYVDAPVQGEPVWDSRRLVCPAVASHVLMQPGESRRFTRVTRAAEILGDSLVLGRYQLAAFMQVEVRQQWRQIELPTGPVGLRR
jgi:hypothetical protein